MGAILNKTQYVSASNAQPFALTLQADHIPAPEGERTVFHIGQTNNGAIYALVEGIVSAGSLAITQIIETSGDPIPLFSGGVTIHSALNSQRLSAEQGQGRDAILLIGQSNMAGHNGEDEEAGLRGYDAALDEPNPRILQLRKTSRYTLDHDNFLTDTTIEDQYVIASDPLDHANDAGVGNGAVRATSAGLGITLAKRYAQTTSRQVVIIPAARGSTGLVAGGTSQAAPNGAEYLHAVAVTNEFLAEHPDNRLILIADQQGETDAFAIGTLAPGQWGTAKSINITAFRANGTLTPTVRQPTFERVPYVMGQVTSTGADSITINQDIDDIVASTPYTARALYDITWLKGGSFDLHVDAVGLREWGHIFYAEYINALDNLPALPAMPTQVQNLAATQDPTVVHLTWDALPVQDPVVIAYNVQFKVTSAGDETYSTPTVLGSAAVAHDVTGLTNGTDYTFRVFASSLAGDGPFALITETPELDLAPTAPANFAAIQSVPGITLTWNALVFDPAVTGYTVQRKLSTDPTFNPTDDVDLGLVTTYDFTTPTNGVTYDFRVFAFNVIGDGTPTAVESVTFASSPTAALNPVAWYRRNVGVVLNGAGRVASWTDQSGNGNDANGSLQTDNPPSLEADGRIQSLSGSDNILALGDTLAFPNSAMTLVFDALKINTNDQDYFFHTLNGYIVWARSTGRIEFRSTGSTSISTSNNLFSANTRFQFAVSVSATGRYRILDSTGTVLAENASGVLDTNGTRASLIARSTNSSYTGVGNELDGGMYNFVAFDQELTPAEVASVIGEFT